jgi:hypothetical protein
MPIQYTWTCKADIPANTKAYTEVAVSCVEDPVRGSESVIQRIYPILIDTILVTTAPTVDYVVTIKKESVDGTIRPVATSIPASVLKELISVSGQLPFAFTDRGRPAVIYVAPMEKLSLFVIPLADVATATTVNFVVVAEKGA